MEIQHLNLEEQYFWCLLNNNQEELKKVKQELRTEYEKIPSKERVQP